METLLLLFAVLVAVVCSNDANSPVAGSAEAVAEVCGVCADVWLKVRPRTGPSPILPALETGDDVSAECLQLVMNGGQPVSESLGVVPSSCANYQKILHCYSAVNSACVGCKQLSWREECVAADGDGKPSFCRGHAALSAEDMSLAAWVRIFYWKAAHCTLPLIPTMPYPGDTSVFANDFWFKHSRMAEWERQQASNRRRLEDKPEL